MPTTSSYPFLTQWYCEYSYYNHVSYTRKPHLTGVPMQFEIKLSLS